MNINTETLLTDDMISFVDSNLQLSNFHSAKEFLPAFVNLLEERNRKIEALRRDVEKGKNSGINHDFDFDTFIAETEKELISGKYNA